MIRIENTGVYGFEAAIRGMRNPMNSWDKSDSHVCACADGYLDCPMVLNDDEPAKECDPDKYNFCVGVKDFCLMKKLAAAGTNDRFIRPPVRMQMQRVKLKLNQMQQKAA